MDVNDMEDPNLYFIIPYVHFPEEPFRRPVEVDKHTYSLITALRLLDVAVDCYSTYWTTSRGGFPDTSHSWYGDDI